MKCESGIGIMASLMARTIVSSRNKIGAVHAHTVQGRFDYAVQILVVKAVLDTFKYVSSSDTLPMPPGCRIRDH